MGGRSCGHRPCAVGLYRHGTSGFGISGGVYLVRDQRYEWMTRAPATSGAIAPKVIGTSNRCLVCLRVGGEHAAVGFDQIVYQVGDLIQVQFRRRVRIEHGGMVNMLALAGEGCLNR